MGWFSQAGRALRAAMPLLHRFTEVDVMLADPDTPNLSRDIANYLAAHNISANINTESSRDRNTAQMILKEAQNTDLVIMGAYGFSVTLKRFLGVLPKQCVPNAGRQFYSHIKQGNISA